MDTLGFAGCKMVRRIVGIAHVEDMDSIADADLRLVTIIKSSAFYFTTLSLTLHTLLLLIYAQTELHVNVKPSFVVVN